MRLRQAWAGLLQRLPQSWGRVLVFALVAALLYWNAHQWWQLRPGGKAPPQVPNAVQCAECDWCDWRTTEHLPQRCPRCHKVTVHFAGLCPKCGEWTPWNPVLEEYLYAHPRLFLELGPAHFFPKCRKCGTQTTPRGAAPVARRPILIERSAPGAQGDRQ